MKLESSVHRLLVLICALIALTLGPFSLVWSCVLNTTGGPFGNFENGPTPLFFLASVIALLAGILVLVFGRSRWRWLLLLLLLPSAFSLLYHFGNVMFHP